MAKDEIKRLLEKSKKTLDQEYENSAKTKADQHIKNYNYRGISWYQAALQRIF